MKALVVLNVAFALSASADTVNFDSADTGNTPRGWTGTKTGSGHPKWAVVADDSAPSRPNVLKQSGEAAYPVAFKTVILANGFL